MDRLVRAEGFEPTSLAALEPKSSCVYQFRHARQGHARTAAPRAARLISRCCGRAPRKWGAARRRQVVRGPMQPRLTRRTSSPDWRGRRSLPVRAALRAQPTASASSAPRDGGYDGAVPGPVLRVQARRRAARSGSSTSSPAADRDPLARRARAERDGRRAAADPEAGRAGRELRLPLHAARRRDVLVPRAVRTRRTRALHGAADRRRGRAGRRRPRRGADARLAPTTRITANGAARSTSRCGRTSGCGCGCSTPADRLVTLRIDRPSGAP